MTYTLTSDSYNVTLNTPSSMIHLISKNVENIIFNDNTDVQLDTGKNEYSITLNGLEVSTASAKMQTINNMMDAKETVTITGLDDSSLNTDYVIRDFSFNRNSGEIDRYSYSLTLERIHDNI